LLWEGYKQSGSKFSWGDIRNWVKLKFLKHQSTWKPSNKQIEAIRLARTFVTDDFDEHPALSDTLVELEKQLEKIINL